MTNRKFYNLLSVSKQSIPFCIIANCQIGSYLIYMQNNHHYSVSYILSFDIDVNCDKQTQRYKYTRLISLPKCRLCFVKSLKIKRNKGLKRYTLLIETQKFQCINQNM